MVRKKSTFILFYSLLLIFTKCILASDKIERIIFEERQIEGKIRRPQLILIKAEQRPEFSPMIIQSFDSELNPKEFCQGETVEKSPYSGAFSFDGNKISNYVP